MFEKTGTDLFLFFEFCFAIAAHAHRTVVLTALVFGVLCDEDASVVAASL